MICKRSLICTWLLFCDVVQLPQKNFTSLETESRIRVRTEKGGSSFEVLILGCQEL